MAITDTLLNRVFDGRYLVERKLGSGGMADVYLAEDQELGRNVALKMLNERHAADEQFVERFRREAQSAAGLNHPNIVSIFDRGQAEGTYYIAMEYLDGRTLKELITSKGPTPIPIAVDYARQILSAVGYSHRKGIVHRDIKPHNVVVGPDGRLKVTDFGIARSGTSQMTEAGSIVGTAQYLSPEQARGASVDARSDLYSLGIVLYEMLTGQVPFTGDAPVEIAMKHLQTTPVPPSELRHDVPHELDAVVMRAIAKDPEQRYQTAEEMDADLARVARGVAVSPRTEEALTQILSGVGAAAPTMVARPGRVATPPPAPPVYRPPAPYYGYQEPPRRRSPWPWLLALLAIVIAAGAGYLLYHKIQKQLNQNKPIDVVDVGLLRGDLAAQKLQAEGFKVNVKLSPDANVPKNEVISQDPAAGQPEPKGSIVTITVSTGKPKVSVPAVKGFTLTQAISTLANAQLRSKPVAVYSLLPANTITGQAPKAGAMVVTGTVVHVNYSRGPQPISVPNVVGDPFANAVSALQGAGFVVARTDIDSQQPKGQVVAQDPIAGSNGPKGSKITLSVSKGPSLSQVPDVTGQTEADAKTLLAGAGYKTQPTTQPVTDPSEDGLVIAQDPVGGAQAKNGTTVTITVGQLVQQATTTTTTTTPTTTTPTTTTSPGGTTTTTTTTTTPASP
ncbi:MAG: Stk1 family PASTA domain-containing Ser/Thr kinase [Actinobacteria bacterium]|nr:Stk1 family PASTA domain-containing Ser/Thr kinase [Actinomycetota bacterium]